MSFTREDYRKVFNFAREQYYWHECTGRGFDMKAAVIMSMCEDVIGQQSDFPIEARQRLAEKKKKPLERIHASLATPSPGGDYE